jgi:glucosamine 6-phosphate synthetase-like amidotransferase/phosphosugar isomerase protein
MMALQLSDDSISKEERRQQIIDGLHEIPAQIKGVLMMDKALQQLAKETLAKEKSLLIMGRGYQCGSLGPISVQTSQKLTSDLPYAFQLPPVWRVP